MTGCAAGRGRSVTESKLPRRRTPAQDDTEHPGLWLASREDTAKPRLVKDQALSPGPGDKELLEMLAFADLDLDNQESLGKGSFGTVRKVRLKGQEKRVYALKSMRKAEVIDSNLIERVEREISVQCKLKHKNILRLYRHFDDGDNVYLLLEYCAKGELYQLLRTQRGRRFSEPDACQYFIQVADGLAYLHSNGIIHRDIKPENLLVDHENVLKIADFGWCGFASTLRVTVCGTLDYLAPEMLQATGHDHNLDTWSAGVLLYEMLVGRPPFQSTDHRLLISRILTLDLTFPDFVSSKAQDLVKRLLKRKPHDRMSMSEVPQHPWVQQVSAGGPTAEAGNSSWHNDNGDGVTDIARTSREPPDTPRPRPRAQVMSPPKPISQAPAPPLAFAVPLPQAAEVGMSCAENDQPELHPRPVTTRHEPFPAESAITPVAEHQELQAMSQDRAPAEKPQSPGQAATRRLRSWEARDAMSPGVQNACVPATIRPRSMEPAAVLAASPHARAAAVEARPRSSEPIGAPVLRTGSLALSVPSKSRPHPMEPSRSVLTSRRLASELTSVSNETSLEANRSNERPAGAKSCPPLAEKRSATLERSPDGAALQAMRPVAGVRGGQPASLDEPDLGASGIVGHVDAAMAAEQAPMTPRRGLGAGPSRPGARRQSSAPSSQTPVKTAQPVERVRGGATSSSPYASPRVQRRGLKSSDVFETYSEQNRHGSSTPSLTAGRHTRPHSGSPAAAPLPRPKAKAASEILSSPSATRTTASASPAGGFRRVGSPAGPAPLSLIAGPASARKPCSNFAEDHRLTTSPLTSFRHGFSSPSAGSARISGRSAGASALPGPGHTGAGTNSSSVTLNSSATLTARSSPPPCSAQRRLAAVAASPGMGSAAVVTTLIAAHMATSVASIGSSSTPSREPTGVCPSSGVNIASACSVRAAKQSNGSSSGSGCRISCSSPPATAFDALSTTATSSQAGNGIRRDLASMLSDISLQETAHVATSPATTQQEAHERRMQVALSPVPSTRNVRQTPALLVRHGSLGSASSQCRIDIETGNAGANTIEYSGSATRVGRSGGIERPVSKGSAQRTPASYSSREEVPISATPLVERAALASHAARWKLKSSTPSPGRVRQIPQALAGEQSLSGCFQLKTEVVPMISMGPAAACGAGCGQPPLLTNGGSTVVAVGAAAVSQCRSPPGRSPCSLAGAGSHKVQPAAWASGVRRHCAMRQTGSAPAVASILSAATAITSAAAGGNAVAV